MSNNIKKSLFKQFCVIQQEHFYGNVILGKMTWKHAEICIETEYLVLL